MEDHPVENFQVTHYLDAKHTCANGLKGRYNNNRGWQPTALTDTEPPSRCGVERLCGAACLVPRSAVGSENIFIGSIRLIGYRSCNLLRGREGGDDFPGGGSPSGMGLPT
ncbi:MAG: hypothetical protein JJU34_19165 [Lunatimonas sp.]|uniref:hypothetical protein n=1 Tax=Lunatimonas sp. TaxID=2060141 RepID=UPI00263AAFBF|nr:hypothetical protein [Lunatimonas sp.]MCC5939407.1 hypothetical protein [Lunatimonas sp.]